MHEALAMAMATGLVQDHLRAAANGSLARSLRSPEPEPFADGDVAIRIARPDDAQPLARLAALDADGRTAAQLVALTSEPWQRGVLVAEVDDELVAAAPVAGGRGVADPFRPTAAIAQLLRVRAEQLRRAAAPTVRRTARLSLHPRTH